MNFHIATCAFGRRCQSWATVWYNSIRIIGGYDGPIYIFTDNENFLKDSKANLVQRDDKLEIILVKGLATREQKNHFRFNTDHLYNKEGFILFMDCDIVCKRSINPIFEFCNSMLKGKVGYVRESLPDTSKYYRKYFDLIGRSDMLGQNFGINAGFFIADSTVFKNLMEDWKTIHYEASQKKSSLYKTNQTMFNWIIYSGRVSSVNLPRYFVTFPEYVKKNQLDRIDEFISDDDIFNHITGVNDSSVLKIMKKTFNENSDAKIGDIML